MSSDSSEDDGNISDEVLKEFKLMTEKDQALARARIENQEIEKKLRQEEREEKARKKRKEQKRKKKMRKEAKRKKYGSSSSDDDGNTEKKEKEDDQAQNVNSNSSKPDRVAFKTRR